MTIRGHGFTSTQIEQIEDFLEIVVEAGMQAMKDTPEGVVRDFAEEVVDMLVDRKIELAVLRDAGS